MHGPLTPDVCPADKFLFCVGRPFSVPFSSGAPRRLRHRMAVPSSPFIGRSGTPIGFGSIVPDAPQPVRFSSLPDSNALPAHAHAMVPRTPRSGRRPGAATSVAPSTPRDPRMTPGLTDGLVPSTPTAPTRSSDRNESPALVPRTPVQPDRRGSSSNAGQTRAYAQEQAQPSQPIRLTSMIMGSGGRRRPSQHGQRGTDQSIMMAQSPMRRVQAGAPEADSRPGGLILDL